LLSAILFEPAFTQKLPDKVKGGYKKCNVYMYSYKFGKIDIKSKMELYTCKYDSRGNMIEKVQYNSDDSIESKNTHKYDSRGNRIEAVGFNEWDEPTGKEEYIYSK